VGLWGSLHAQYVTTPVNTDTRTLNTGYQVGSIPGSLTASANGSSNYQVPIQVPPGVNGLVPSLSVNYNSGSSNGLLGYGVNLTGISFISRGANSFIQDGNSKKVDYNTSDALYLGGSRLILVSGTYGAANSEYRLDNSNKVRVNLYGSTTSIYFKVWMPNGRTYLYGNDSNSRLSGSSGNLRWYVKSISDYDGNSISYSYINDTYGFRINQISYAGNAINFEYASRDDKITQYFEGLEIKQHKILSKIKVNGQGSRFREYQFSYYKDIYSYLNEIKVFGTDGTQLNSTVLNWGKSNDFTRYKTSKQKNSNIKQYGDFNGDGRADYLEYPDKTSYTTSDKYNVYITGADGKSETSVYQKSLSSKFAGFQITDFNGDGKDDIFAPFFFRLVNGSGGFYMFTYIYYKDGQFVSKSPYPEYDVEDYIQFFHADVDGDRVKDLILFEKSGSNFNFKEIIGKQGSGLPQIKATDEISPHHFTNNGNEDIFILTGSQLQIYEYNENKTFVKKYESSILNRNEKYKIADFNGDGIDDILNISDEKLFYGTGNNYAEAKYPVTFPESGVDDKDKIVLTGDFNGDGIADIYQMHAIYYDDFSMYIDEVVAKVHYGTGGKLFKTEIRTDLKPFKIVNPSDPIVHIDEINIADFNGDNIDDLIFSLDYSASRYQKLLSDDTGNANLLTKVADGMNNKYAISYQRTNDGAIYSQDASTGDANLSYYQGKNKMVKGISMTSDGTTISNTTYKYKNQTVHKNYGFLGCKEYTQSESVQNAESTSNFEFLGAYYVGALKSTSSKLSGSLVSSASFTNNVAKVNGSKGFRLISYLTAQSQTDHVKGITNTVSYSGFDSYYNPTSVSKNLGGALSETQSISYSNLVNSTYWLPGRLSSVNTTQDHTDHTAISTTTKWVYSNHHLSSKTGLYGTPKAVTETYAYSSGKVSSLTLSGSGVTSRTTSFVYDATRRFVTQETNPLGHVTKAAYDPVTGNQLTVTDANNRVTSFTYNGFGQPLKTNYPDGTSNTNTISWNSSVTGCVYKASSTLTGNAPSSSYFDRLGRVIRSEGKGYNSKTIKTDTRYDSKGRVAAISLPFSSTKTAEKTFAYDTYGRPSATTLP
ncbi:FG-GAP-like repeat-containing protein, partial [Labilibaculum sp. K2S]|uniref:FG-GAP-like repeat-containing protein n=1 Tax=Labilibaculum sp. K2S TaxID=3056386 RepID=UPI0025A42CC6